MSKVSPLAARSVAVAALLAVAASRAPAQVPQVPQLDKPARTTGWQVAPIVSSETELNDNVFLLTTSKRDNLSAPSVDALASGRYAGMEQAMDLVTTVRAALNARGRGLGGRRLEIMPELRYELYAVNAERRNATASLTLEQAMRRGGRARLRARLTPDYFARNYLADALDADDDGSIAPAERIYRAGRYREMELGLDYRLRLNKSTKKHPFGAALQLGAGYYGRAFEAPFASRDIAGPTAGAALLLDLTRRLSLDISYDLAAMGATPGAEVLLLDEPAFGRDFNGNGSDDDLAARAFETVDRSRTEHDLGVETKVELTRNTALRAGLRHRARRYTSDAEFDVANNGRSAGRNEVEVGLTRELTESLRLMAGVGFASQVQNRESDPGATGDEADYRRTRARLGLLLRF